MKVENISNLITIREFAVRNLDNIYFKMSSEEVKVLRNKITLLDRRILDAILQLDLNIDDPKVESLKKKNETPTAKQL